jgi:alkanesulfonate monooxygenase SsuD/methylene tetrahydromethanopterin reductase-like flavin-dependent oxidoreductase (luciferase family)
VSFTLRFDFRNPDFAGTSTADQYAAALDMAEWADRLGCASITVSEHHGSADGYLPGPVPMLAAMAARTTSVRLRIAALAAPFHDPLRLAEDLLVLDNLSAGRLDVVVAAGYVREEFELFGVAMKERPRRVSEVVTTLKGAFSGKPFDYRGRRVTLTPGPFRPGGPKVSMGGSSEGAARRAARIADGFMPTDPGSWDFYRDELAALGQPDPGPFPLAGAGLVALAQDEEKGWQQLAPYLLHHTNAYGQWQSQNDTGSPYRTVSDVEALRRAGHFRVLTPQRLLEDLTASPSRDVHFHPLCGGIPTDLAWSSLRLFEREVLPELP